MRKVHWISLGWMAVVPMMLAGACSGNDSSPAKTESGGSAAGGGSGSGAGGSSSGGSAGSSSNTGGAGGSSNTGGSSSATGGSSGSAGSGGSGMAGMAGTAASEGGAGSQASDGGKEAGPSDDGSSTKCTTAGNQAEGKSCKDYCDAFYKVCQPNQMFATKYTSKMDCAAKCATFTLDQMCCRTQHAINIAGMTSPMASEITLHCGHAIGMAPDHICD